MATRGPSYGFSREVKMKLKAKYDPEKEQDLRDWINDMTGETLPEELSFQKCLRDGIVLCELMESINSGSIKKKLPHRKTPLKPFHCMENICEFLQAAEKYGLKRLSLFQTADLYDDANMSQVQACLLELVNLAKSKGDTDTDLGIYVAEKQEKQWTEEELRRGEGIIGLQAGTNKCASQTGMTAYGSSRTVYNKKYTGTGTE